MSYVSAFIVAIYAYRFIPPPSLLFLWLKLSAQLK